MFQLDELSPSHWPNPPPPTGHATGDSRVVENIVWTLFAVGLKSTRHINGSRKPLDFNKPWSCYGFLTCSYLKLFEIALSPPLINRNSVQNHLNYPTESQPITDSCHNNSLPPNPSSMPTSNHRLCLLFLNHWSCQRLWNVLCVARTSLLTGLLGYV